MAAPSPSFIVTDPPPLNSTVFPYAVNAIDMQWLVSFAGIIQQQILTGSDPAPLPVNKHRYE